MTIAPSKCAFLGPSTPQNFHTGDIVVLPPVKIGDVYRACEARYQVMLIVDGFFEGVPSVRHTEILYALSQGCIVGGAASMGALRAAEMDTYGMIGIGAVYDLYRTGALEDDDEVAVLHGDQRTGYESFTVPMINIRAAIDDAVAHTIITVDEGDTIINFAKGLFYADRQWDRILAISAEKFIPPESARALNEHLTRAPIDIKRQDAELALNWLQQCDGSEHGHRPTFSPTANWMDFIAAEGP